ncbi:hypothetical protein ACTXT7_015368 [Hymenolepis weldensis]
MLSPRHHDEVREDLAVGMASSTGTRRYAIYQLIHTRPTYFDFGDLVARTDSSNLVGDQLAAKIIPVAAAVTVSLPCPRSDPPRETSFSLSLFLHPSPLLISSSFPTSSTFFPFLRPLVR